MVPRDMVESLKEIAYANGATLFTVLLAAYKGLLYRISGQDDIIVGIPTAGRKGRKTRNLVGLFINTLALRTRIGRGEAFDSLLKKVSEATRNGLRNQGLPFTKVVEEVQPDLVLVDSHIFKFVS